jgi:hypothetical protein
VGVKNDKINSYIQKLTKETEFRGTSFVPNWSWDIGEIRLRGEEFENKEKK